MLEILHRFVGDGPPNITLICMANHKLPYTAAQLFCSTVLFCEDEDTNKWLHEQLTELRRGLRPPAHWKHRSPFERPVGKGKEGKKGPRKALPSVELDD